MDEVEIEEMVPPPTFITFQPLPHEKNLFDAVIAYICKEFGIEATIGFPLRVASSDWARLEAEDTGLVKPPESEDKHDYVVRVQKAFIQVFTCARNFNNYEEVRLRSEARDAIEVIPFPSSNDWTHRSNGPSIIVYNDFGYNGGPEKSNDGFGFIDERRIR
ncbi:hypothetical protein IAD21_03708 [Abditibacteriota bacterium]|nr:hypothetical protein IAD21_03708 [Abditibacteriota bacterium]